jgi:hypothetical protein
MYAIPIIFVIVLALIAVAWSPIFALIIFAIGFALFLGYVASTRRADEKLAPPEQPGAQPHHETDAHTGLWGERRP